MSDFNNKKKQQEKKRKRRRQIRSQKSPATLLRLAEAVEHASTHRSHQVVVIPADLSAGPDQLRRKNGDPRKAEIVRVHKHVLHEHIGRTTVIKPAANIAERLGVHTERLGAERLQIRVRTLNARVGQASLLQTLQKVELGEVVVRIIVGVLHRLLFGHHMARIGA